MIPEGLLSHLSHYKELIDELNSLLTNKTDAEQKEIVSQLLSGDSAVDTLLSYFNAPVFKQLPDFIKS